MKTTRTKTARFVAAVTIGLIAGMIAGMSLGWRSALLVGWDATVIILVGLIWHDFRGQTAAETAAVARRDDMDRSTLDGIVLLTSIASIAAVVSLLTDKNASILHVAFGLISIILSWIAVHTLYTLRYAALYYRNIEGGIDFGGSEKPVFGDFVYLAFTIGMTYQVSDTSITASDIRRVALGHALISFVFGVAIIATTINFLVGLTN